MSTQACNSASELHSFFRNDGNKTASVFRTLPVDSSFLMPLLAKSYIPFLRQHKGTVILDVGANSGASSQTLLQLFTGLPIVQDLSAAGQERMLQFQDDYSALKNVRVLAFEPVASTYQRLAQRGSLGKWHQAGWNAYHVAISDTSGKQLVYSRVGEERHLLSSLSRAATLLQPMYNSVTGQALQHTQAEEVQVFTLDEIAPELNLTNVYLLKSDVEGYDPKVLVGAQRLISERRIQWLLFEYNAQWSVVETPAILRDGRKLDTLRSVTTWLFEQGYMCFTALEDMLLPLYSYYWSDVFETKSWGNILCGLSHSAHVHAHPSNGVSAAGTGKKPAHVRAHWEPVPELEALVEFYNYRAPVRPCLAVDG